jgi:hypothetical protein
VLPPAAACGRNACGGAETLSTGQILDVLFGVGGYRSSSILINSAGVQLDANMADFRFPPALR